MDILSFYPLQIQSVQWPRDHGAGSNPTNTIARRKNDGVASSQGSPQANAVDDSLEMLQALNDVNTPFMVSTPEIDSVLTNDVVNAVVQQDLGQSGTTTASSDILQTFQGLDTAGADLAMLQDLWQPFTPGLETASSSTATTVQNNPFVNNTSGEEQTSTLQQQLDTLDSTLTTFEMDFFLGQMQRMEQYDQLGGMIMSGSEFLSQLSLLA
jgi:hypothetical protein